MNLKHRLTLILSSVESLGTELKSKNSVNKEINLMYNNSKGLLRLINQLLDYRKVEDKKFILRASIANLFDFQIVLLQILKEKQRNSISISLMTNLS
jgi:signal transduction histidine kinase